MKIAIIYICTGKYDVFWDDFYASSEKYFYPEIEKHYFVFTDSKRMLELKASTVHPYYQCKSGWPYDTLLRFNWICTIQDKLTGFDFCYFCNANSLFLKEIDQSLIPLPSEEKPLILSIHVRGYEDTTGALSSPERNPKSTAYIPEGTYCRAHSGGFWGGLTENFLLMCRTLRDRIAQDLNNGIIAIWHDQSHLIKYATEVKHYNVQKGIVASEEYADMKICAMIYRNKEHYGGNDELRDIDFVDRLKHLPRKCYSRILVLCAKVNLDMALRKIVHLFRK